MFLAFRLSATCLFRVELTGGAQVVHRTASALSSILEISDRLAGHLHCRGYCFGAVPGAEFVEDVAYVHLYSALA
jgi:hypothetical protein